MMSWQKWRTARSIKVSLSWRRKIATPAKAPAMGEAQKQPRETREAVEEADAVGRMIVKERPPS